jgi:hypothetical protein
MDTDNSDFNAEARRQAMGNEDEADWELFPPTRRRLVDDREPGWDCVSQMRLARSRPEVLAKALLAMGITESGDEMPDYQERTE